MVYQVIIVNFNWVGLAKMKPLFCWEEGGEKELTELEIRLSEANGCVCLLGSNNSNLPLNRNNSS